jgi:putative nucleotidyltransferase with HDIG domain
VVLPFAALSMIVGLLVSGVAAEQMASAAQTQVATLALREQDSVNAVLASFEQRQLVDLRALTATQGVPQAIARGDRADLEARLLPIVANQLPDRLEASVIQADGRELLRLRADPQQPDRCLCDGGRDLRAAPHVGDILAGVADSLGPKYGGVFVDQGVAKLYTDGPVLDGDQPEGAILVSEPLPQLLHELRATSRLDAALYLADGTFLSSTDGFPVRLDALPASERQLALKDGQRVHRTAGGGQLEVFNVPWSIRDKVLGYAAVVVPAGAMAAAAAGLTPALLGIFMAALALTVVAGTFVARRITKPLSALVKATDAVGAGRLDHRAEVLSNDELGQLSRSFNEMIASLEAQARQLDESTEATVRALAAALDARDRYTHGHSLRVTAYALVLARAAGIDEAGCDTVRRGCLVHDIGKIGVPDDILRKPGRLDPDEQDAMRSHPLIGHEMLKSLAWEPAVFEIIRNHHERWDGGGYPDGLAGEAIPWLARLVAIADTLDAMTSDRPYRRAFDFRTAAAEIEAAGGAQFDPAAVELFKQCRAELEEMLGLAEAAEPEVELVG